jgi:arabinofuranosyltransferase
MVTAIVLFVVVILVSYPISWTHWSLTKSLESREQAHILIVPVHPSFPEGLQWYAKPFDNLQAWLIERHVCMRRQEHRLFYEFQAARYPSREAGENVSLGDYPVMALTMVGVPGWVFPHVNIIDQYGLNDYVIARNNPVERPHRLMAHDRQAPPGYVESFEPNLAISPNGRIERYPRESVLTAQRIIDVETYFRDVVSQDRD